MSYKKLRRSGRISKSVPILLIGSDTDGRMFSEETRTVVLSLHGAGVISFHKLLAEQELVLRSLETNREAEIRVVGEIGMQGDKHTYGVAFVDDYLDFWQMEFPPPPSPQERPLELLLECSTCGNTVTLLNGDFEFDVCAIHGGLVRHCTECGFATVWKRPESGGERAAQPRMRQQTDLPGRPKARIAELKIPPQQQAQSGPPQEERLPGSEELIPIAELPGAAAAQKNENARKTSVAVEDRRQRVRAKVNYFACVRSEAFGDDIVTCIDMSRGGLGFWTKNPYVVSSEVRIAVPFAPESPNAPAIFVTARVVNIAESQERKMFRCGVMFTPASGAQAHT
jgi:hypothetical protein